MVRGSVSDRTLPGGVGAGLSLGSSGLAGALPDPEDASSFAQAERLKARIEAGAALPTIPFNCGGDDFTIDGNRDLYAHMERIGLEHHYAEHEGAHTWDYWDEHVQEALAQHAGVLWMGTAAD